MKWVRQLVVGWLVVGSWWALGAPIIQGHRGSRGEYGENAAGAFKWAYDKGIRAFETDVRFSKDHELVIMHDARLDRTTDGKGVVEETLLADIRKMHLQSCSEVVPTAAEVMDAIGKHPGITVELEMKAYPSAFYTPEVLKEYCQKLHKAAAEHLAPGTYVFTCFNTNTLATMRAVDRKARLGYIMGKLTEADIATAKQLGCEAVAPTLNTSAALVARAHKAGLKVVLWMVQNAADYALAQEKGADRVTSDFPHLLSRMISGHPKKLIAMDLDATLCQHRSAIPAANLAALKALDKKYKCIMVGAGNAPRIYRQMGNYPIDIVGNYGMQEARAADGNFRIVRQISNEVDRAFFRRETDKLRAKYGYTAYEGEPLEFHASGMVTFGLLGTTPAAEHKVAFDPDKKKRRAMYPEVCEIFKDFAVYIGGSTSFDFAGKQYNKYDATLNWALAHGYKLDDILFIGDDFANGGGDSHVRIKGMDRIQVTDYRQFHNNVSVLLKDPVYQWVDVAKLPLAGRGYPCAEEPFVRIPSAFRGKVPASLSGMGKESTGLNFKFKTTSRTLVFKYEVAERAWTDPLIPPTGLQGLAIWGRWGANAPWEFVAKNHPQKDGKNEFVRGWAPDREGLVYLPMRGVVKNFQIGIEPGATFDVVPYRQGKIVHYGTSIVHGGCVSQPGLMFTSFVSRAFDRDVVNLGFSGSGKMESEMADFLGGIDAALYIIDCDHNMGVTLQGERYEQFVRKLQALRPETPILLCGGCTERQEPMAQEVFAKGVYGKLKKEDAAKWAKLHFFSGVEQLPKESWATHDHCHPNDYGAIYMGQAFIRRLGEILTDTGIDLLARDATGKGAYTIVLGEGASECEKYAAAELNKYLKKMGGLTLAVTRDKGELPARAILLGETRHTAALDKGGAVKVDDAFRLKAAGRHLLVRGLNRGVLYGVYEILERFGGCGWYASWHEVVPAADHLEIPANLDETQTPAFDLRQTSWFDLYRNDEHAARNKMNLPWFQGKLGVSKHRFCPGLGNCHTFKRLLPPEQYFAQHPEYFSEVDGKRKPDPNQPCLTNPEVLKIVTSNVLAAAAQWYPKGVRYFGVSQNDWDHHCTCRNCKALDDAEGTPAASVIQFVNAIAAEVGKQYPEAVIETLAYRYTRNAPKTVKPRHNVMPCLCTIECDFSKPFDESKFAENQTFCQRIKDWGNMSTKLYVWDYTTDFSYYCYTWPNMKSLRRNLKFLHDNGVTQLYVQGDGLGQHGDWAEFKGWLIAKSMWNPNQDEAALTARFFNGYYGPAAATMRKYFDAVHAIPRDEAKNSLDCYENVAAPFISDAFLDQADAWMEQAAREAAHTRYARNVGYTRLAVDFTRAMRYMMKDGGIFCSRHPEALDQKRYRSMQAAARRVVEQLDDTTIGPIALAEGRGYDTAYQAQIRDFAVRPQPTKACDRVILEEGQLSIGSSKTRYDYVADPAAEDGRALWLSNTHYGWSGYFKMPTVKTDKDGVYELRARVRVRKLAGAPETGEAFWTGVYNSDAKANTIPNLSVKVSEIKDEDYHWYTLSQPFTPRAGDLLWVAPGRFTDNKSCHAGVWVDKYELVRVK